MSEELPPLPTLPPALVRHCANYCSGCGAAFSDHYVDKEKFTGWRCIPENEILTLHQRKEFMVMSFPGSADPLQVVEALKVVEEITGLRTFPKFDDRDIESWSCEKLDEYIKYLQEIRHIVEVTK